MYKKVEKINLSSASYVTTDGTQRFMPTSMFAQRRYVSREYGSSWLPALHVS
jgi:hypothetical protein